MSKYRKKYFLSKYEIALICTIISSVIFFFIYKHLLIFCFDKYYDGLYLAYNGHYYSIIIFLAVVILEVIYYHLDTRKMNMKKYLIVSFLVGSFVFALTLLLSARIWVFTEDRIMYQTLFPSNNICYEYDDIEKAILFYDESVGVKMRGVSPSYDIIMKNGKELSVCLFESYYTSYECLIEFDKKISSKRITKGNFIDLHIEEELNDYYEGVFN